MDLLKAFAEHIDKKKYWEKDEPVLVAVSGGVDSVVLLDLLSRLPQELRPVITVVHLDHDLRETSAEEAEFVSHLALSYGADALIRRWPKQEHPNNGLEAEARTVRYTFFKEAAAQSGTCRLLTAHHQNDQVETVLMRLVRGNSLQEITGIQAVRQDGGIIICRPLLPFSKKELIAYAKDRKLAWYEDESNASDRFTRNRFRNRVIPLLKQENPMVEDHLIEFSEEVRDLLELIEPMIESRMEEVIAFQEHEMLISREKLLNCPPALQLKLLARAFSQWELKKDFMIKKVHLTLLRDWLTFGRPNSVLDLPSGLEAVRSYDSCVISFKAKKPSPSEYGLNQSSPVYTLDPGSQVELAGGGKLALLSLDQYRQLPALPSARLIYLDPEEEQLPLMIRRRQEGDRLRLKGMNGTKKVKDIFIDQKVPLADREKAWLVTDRQGELVWLVNYKESALSLDPITDTISYVLVYTDTR